MPGDIKVSVILPVYNVERYLKKCMEDILGQSLKEIEVICVDDGSTDGSLDILRTFEKGDSRVRVFTQTNKGAAAARNHGMETATGKYLSFLDSDDFFEKDMLKRAWENAENTGAEMVIFRGNRYDDTLEKYIQMNYSIKSQQLPPNNPFTYKDIPEHIFTFAVGWAWDKLYLRDFVEKQGIRFQELRTSNDLYFVFSSLVKAKSIYIVDELLVHHRIHVKGSLSVTREKSWNCFYEASKALKEELSRMGIYEEVEKGFVNWALHFCFWNLDTIEGQAYEKVYDLINGECSREFGFFNHNRDYYGQKELYDRMVKMRDKSCVEYLLCENLNIQKEKEKAFSRVKGLEQEVQAIRESSTFRVGKKVMALPIRIKKKLKGENHA